MIIDLILIFCLSLTVYLYFWLHFMLSLCLHFKQLQPIYACNKVEIWYEFYFRTIIVMFVFWISNLLLTLLLLFHPKCHLEISAAASAFASTAALALKKLHFCPMSFFLEFTSQYSFLCFVIRHQYHFVSSSFLLKVLFISPYTYIGVLSKGLFEFPETPCHYYFRETAAPKIFGNFSIKHPRWCPI